MTGLLDVLAYEIAALDEADLDRYAATLEPLVARLNAASARAYAPSEPEPDRWLTARKAAAYLGLTLDALYKLTASRSIPFEQYGPGCKLWFRHSSLDAWRRGEWS